MPKKSTESVPRTWGLDSWPPDVWPNSTNKARWVVRSHRDKLIAEGAVSRVGRQLVIHGPRYSRFLEKNAANVPDFEIAPNRAGSA